MGSRCWWSVLPASRAREVPDLLSNALDEGMGKRHRPDGTPERGRGQTVWLWRVYDGHCTGTTRDRGCARFAGAKPPKGGSLSDHDIRMVVLSTDNLDESIKFYTETLGMPLKFRDGSHFAALDGGSITLALATAVDHPMPGQVVVGIKTDDVDGAAQAVEANGGAIVKGPYNDAHERRAVVYDHKGNGLVFYSPLPR
jgi:lactoylglutathione lyase